MEREREEKKSEREGERWGGSVERGADGSVMIPNCLEIARF